MAPHRRAGPPGFVSFMSGLRFASLGPGASGPDAAPRGSGSPTIPIGDGRPRPSGSRSSGGHLPAGRIRPVVAPGVARPRRGPAGPRRVLVLRQVPRMAGPRAGGVAADRAEDGVPQPAAARHALARLGIPRVLHGWSALLTRPARCRRTGNRRGGPVGRRRSRSPPARTSFVISTRGGLVAIRRVASRTPGTPVLPHARWPRRPGAGGLLAAEGPSPRKACAKSRGCGLNATDVRRRGIPPGRPAGSGSWHHPRGPETPPAAGRARAPRTAGGRPGSGRGGSVPG